MTLGDAGLETEMETEMPAHDLTPSELATQGHAVLIRSGAP
jgi:hypothetical protein